MIVRSATAATYEWLSQEYTADETWLCAAFVKNVRPEEALRRIGVTPGPFTGDYGFGVTAFAATGGTALVEVGWGEIVYHRADVLSAGSAAAAVAVSSDSADFTYCEDGRPITTFSLYECRSRQGAEPDRLAADLQDLGMDTDFTDPGWRGAPRSRPPWRSPSGPPASTCRPHTTPPRACTDPRSTSTLTSDPR